LKSMLCVGAVFVFTRFRPLELHISILPFAMHWVYVLLSDDGDIYVGETTRLFRRWNEHQTGRGGANTSSGDYNTVIGLYKVSSNRSFRRYLDDRAAWRVERYWDDEVDKYDALEIENLVTERYLVERGITKHDIKGGRYTVESRCETFCFGGGAAAYKKDRPLCKCGYPCEVNLKKDKTKIYFTCPVPDWVEGYDTPEKCNFWEEYSQYREEKAVPRLRQLTAAEAFADCID